ncbi:helix-turn-helix domain-containing protein [Pedobacter panaciterrae]|uniref:helix-turn-helix domain-containing protein n=1 Tax=Pedobacter panaciterrae TaxID=363849 RepID=UPI0025990CDE|nr:helix-turn-helix transcriptional regulator [uncultured Pedobacter sp.]
MNVAQNIKRIRLQRNYAQKYIAQVLGMTHSNYCKIENGFVSIKKERIEKIAAILGVTLEELTDPGKDA